MQPSRLLAFSLLAGASACGWAMGASPSPASGERAVGAGIDCVRAADPVDRMMCADPALRRLDARLSAAYAGALQRDAAHAAALRQDERDWLGERNDLAWGELAANRVFAHAGASRTYQVDVPKALAGLYQNRIVFLTHVARPADVRGRPVAAILLAQIASVEPEGQGVLHALESAGVADAPKETDGTLAQVSAALPAPPDPELRKSLSGFITDNWTFEYLPAQRIGLLYTIQGTGDCEDWVVVAPRGGRTVGIHRGANGGLLPRDVLPCARDDGTLVSIAAVNGSAILVAETDGIGVPRVDLRWRRRVGERWAPEVDLALRFNRRVADPPKCADVKALRCTLAPIAVDSLRHYLRDPWSLLHAARLTTAEQARVGGLEKQVQDELAARRHGVYSHSGYVNGDGAEAIWFPVRLGDEVAVGRIAPAHEGAHPVGAWSVRFWGTWQHRWAVALPTWWPLGTVSDTLLTAAVLSPAALHP